MSAHYCIFWQGVPYNVVHVCDQLANFKLSWFTLGNWKFLYALYILYAILYCTLYLCLASSHLLCSVKHLTYFFPSLKKKSLNN